MTRPGNVNNSVSVTGNVTSGETTTQVADTYDGVCPFDPVEAIEIVKSCPVVPDGARVGDTISYEVTVTNTGDVVLTEVDVVDPGMAPSRSRSRPSLRRVTRPHERSRAPSPSMMLRMATSTTASP